MKKLAIIVALAAIGCGDNLKGNTPPGGDDGGIDAGVDGPGDADIDAPMGDPTLTTFVIDLIENHTDNGPPAPFSMFEALPDPDGDANNTGAYDPLFP